MNFAFYKIGIKNFGMFRLPNCNELNAFYRFHSDADDDDVVEIHVTQIRSLIDSERLELNSNASNVLYALQRAKTLDATWNASSGLLFPNSIV